MAATELDEETFEKIVWKGIKKAKKLSNLYMKNNNIEGAVTAYIKEISHIFYVHNYLEICEKITLSDPIKKIIREALKEIKDEDESQAYILEMFEKEFFDPGSTQGYSNNGL